MLSRLTMHIIQLKFDSGLIELTDCLQHLHPKNQQPFIFQVSNK